jgi:predicted DNA-binding WGR domain protein
MMQLARYESTTRYYIIAAGRDLFGTYYVRRMWGGKGTRLGGVATESFDDETNALAAVAALVRRRLQKSRGYVLVSSVE